MQVLPIKFESKISAENMDKFMNDIKSGKGKPKFRPVSETPAIQSLAKQSYYQKNNGVIQ